MTLVSIYLTVNLLPQDSIVYVSNKTLETTRNAETITRTIVVRSFFPNLFLTSFRLFHHFFSHSLITRSYHTVVTIAL